jgi:DNA-binding MarR family transcriptional regulator
MTYEYVENIEKYLRKVDYIVRKKGREILNDFNMTIPQSTALQIIVNNESLTIGDLSQKMGLACSTITDLIDRMEKTELVIRKRDANDKRVVWIEVLPKGHDILEKVLKKRIEFLNSKLINIEDEDKRALNNLLEKVYEAMGE